MSDSSISKLRSSSFDELLPIWPKGQLFSSGNISNKTLVDSVKAIEKEGLPPNEYLCVYSLKEYKPLYFTKNVLDILGYSNEELVNLKLFSFFNLASISHIGFIYNLKKFENRFKKLVKKKEFKPHIFKTCSAGMKLKTKNGIEKTFIMASQYQVSEHFEMHDTNVSSFIDVSHLFNSKNYWGIYTVFGDTSQRLTKVYFNKGKSLDSFLTPNEQGILRLSIEGFSPEKIQELLNMKKEIYDKHGTNILSKTGANDLSASIQLLNYCGILK